MIRKLFIAMLTRRQLTIAEDLLDLGETERNASNSVNHVQISFTESQRTKLHTRKIDRGKVNEIFFGTMIRDRIRSLEALNFV